MQTHEHASADLMAIGKVSWTCYQVSSPGRGHQAQPAADTQLCPRTCSTVLGRIVGSWTSFPSVVAVARPSVWITGQQQHTSAVLQQLTVSRSSYAPSAHRYAQTTLITVLTAIESSSSDYCMRLRCFWCHGYVASGGCFWRLQKWECSVIYSCYPRCSLALSKHQTRWLGTTTVWQRLPGYHPLAVPAAQLWSLHASSACTWATGTAGGMVTRQRLPRGCCNHPVCLALLEQPGWQTQSDKGPPTSARRLLLHE